LLGFSVVCSVASLENVSSVTARGGVEDDGGTRGDAAAPGQPLPRKAAVATDSAKNVDGRTRRRSVSARDVDRFTHHNAAALGFAPPGNRDVVPGAAKNVLSGMLLGGVTYIMALFYLVSWPNQNIRLYSWQIIGNTISIFVAVLFFQACQRCVMRFVYPVVPIKLLVEAFQLIFWNSVLQIAIGVRCGVLLEGEDELFAEEGNTTWKVLHPAGQHAVGEEIDESLVVEKIGNYGIYVLDDEYGFASHLGAVEELTLGREEDLACYCAMLSHVVAFSGIACFCEVQHSAFFSTNAFTSFFVLPVCFGVNHVLYSFWSHVRRKLSLSGDGTAEEREKLWHEVAKECEEDVVSLVTSFITVQSFRFTIVGRLPDAEGEIKRSPSDPESDVVAAMLGLTTVVFSTIALILIRWFRRNKHSLSELMQGRLRVLQAYTLMVSAWCILFGTKFYTMHFIGFKFGGPQNVLQELVLAVALSIGVFIIIFQLHHLAVMGKTGDDTDCAIISIIKVLGLSIGFSWEACFDDAVLTLSKHVDGVCNAIKVPADISVLQLILSTLVCAIVVPAYRSLIFPLVWRYETLFQKEWDVKDKRALEEMRPQRSARPSLRGRIMAKRSSLMVKQLSQFSVRGIRSGRRNSRIFHAGGRLRNRSPGEIEMSVQGGQNADSMLC